MDAKTIAYAHVSGETSIIYALNVEMGKERVLLRREGILSSPAFSPDGTKMLFVSDMHGGVNIFVQDLATGEIKRLSYFGNYNTSPSYSPKGDLIAFVSKTQGARGNMCDEARRVGRQNTHRRWSQRLTAIFPSGSYILYSSQTGKKTSIKLRMCASIWPGLMPL